MWCVEVVKYKVFEVVDTIWCKSKKDASKVEDGVNINLNHDDYFTRIAQRKKRKSVLLGKGRNK
jgi:hypothetical protein